MPVTGLIFNTKKKVSYKDELTGDAKECQAGRMECMMQNLADSLADQFSSRQNPDTLTMERLSTFMVSNIRRKVTSSAKRKHKPGGSIRQTPEGSFWDLMLNARDILTQCGMDVPEVRVFCKPCTDVSLCRQAQVKRICIVVLLSSSFFIQLWVHCGQSLHKRSRVAE